jgi:hypothetical protein
MNKQYTCTTNQLEVMKWLRANGQRGYDWECHGAKNMAVIIKNSKLETAYILMWEWTGKANPSKRV